MPPRLVAFDDPSIVLRDQRAGCPTKPGFGIIAIQFLEGCGGSPAQPAHREVVHAAGREQVVLGHVAAYGPIVGFADLQTGRNGLPADLPNELDLSLYQPGEGVLRHHGRERRPREDPAEVDVLCCGPFDQRLGVNMLVQAVVGIQRMRVARHEKVIALKSPCRSDILGRGLGRAPAPAQHANVWMRLFDRTCDLTDQVNQVVRRRTPPVRMVRNVAPHSIRLSQFPTLRALAPFPLGIGRPESHHIDLGVLIEESLQVANHRRHGVRVGNAQAHPAAGQGRDRVRAVAGRRTIRPGLLPFAATERKVFRMRFEQVTVFVHQQGGPGEVGAEREFTPALMDVVRYRIPELVEPGEGRGVSSQQGVQVAALSCEPFDHVDGDLQVVRIRRAVAVVAANREVRVVDAGLGLGRKIEGPPGQLRRLAGLRPADA